jgi:transcriptional regulator GlxA family with amidase domain
MSGFARKPAESSRAFDTPSGAEPRAFFDLANEKHYSVVELAKLWALSERTIRRMFENEPGVLCWGSSEHRFKRGYKTLRIPETVMLRVHRRLRIAS